MRHLALLPGGRPERVELAGVWFEPTVEEPPGVDARVHEEDSFLVLSADPEIRPAEEHPLRVLTRILELVPNTPGVALLQAGRPPRILAVVHDLSAEPTTRLEWVREAYRAAAELAKARGFRTLATPLLGTVHGRLPEAEVLEVVRSIAPDLAGAGVERCYLLVPRTRVDAVLAALAPA